MPDRPTPLRLALLALALVAPAFAQSCGPPRTERPGAWMAPPLKLMPEELGAPPPGFVRPTFVLPEGAPVPAPTDEPPLEDRDR